MFVLRHRRHSSQFLCVTALAALALTACAPDVIDLDAEDGVRNAYVVNGQQHNGDPAVGLLRRSNSMCTATLIGKRTVLTAAHCISENNPRGHTIELRGQRRAITRVVGHSAYRQRRSYNYDIALAFLTQDVTDVEPQAIATAPPSAGDSLEVLGFGKTSENGNDAGTKRRAMTTIASVSNLAIGIPASNGGSANVCNGDSGGPSFAVVNGQRVQVGVHSIKTGACGAGGYDVRVDAYRDWINTTASGDVVEAGVTDTVAPVVEITSPQANASLTQGNVQVQATVEDQGTIAKAELFVDSVLVSSLSASPYTFSVFLAAGTHQIQVVATDEAGNRGDASLNVQVGQQQGTQQQGTQQQGTQQQGTQQQGTQQSGAHGTACSAHTDCQSNMCAAFQGRQFCTQTCSTPQSCPGGATCYATGAQNLCGPPSGSQQSAPGADGSSGQQSQGLRQPAAGGCTLGSVPSPLSTWPLLMVTFLISWRRRRAVRK